MSGQYGWADALEILKAMKEGDQAQETRVERCNRLLADSVSSTPIKSPQSSLSPLSSSSAQWKQDAQEWEEQNHSAYPKVSSEDTQWDFEKQDWVKSVPDSFLSQSQNSLPLSTESASGPMREVWMQVHRSLRSLSSASSSTEFKSTESKSTESKSTESKSTESKSTESLVPNHAPSNSNSTSESSS
jgi:hypothetical protein